VVRKRRKVSTNGDADGGDGFTMSARSPHSAQDHRDCSMRWICSRASPRAGRGH